MALHEPSKEDMVMPYELEKTSEAAAIDADDLADRLGWLERWRVGMDASRAAGRALSRVEQHRIAARERVAIFATDIATEKIIGIYAANAVIAMGAIEARLNANAGAADEALDEVVIARVLSSIGARNATLGEIAGLQAAGEITPSERDEMSIIAARQHEKRKADALERGETSHARMRVIVAGGLRGRND
jgi:hypothetical protein